jgi:hypothetical protein
MKLLKKSQVASRKSQVQFCNGDKDKQPKTYGLLVAGDKKAPRFVKKNLVMSMMGCAYAIANIYFLIREIYTSH